MTILSESMVIAVVVLLAVSFVLKLHEWQVCPFRGASRFLRRPWFELALLVFFVGGMVQYGSTKGTNGTDRGMLMTMMRRPALSIAPVAVDSIDFSIPTNFPPITNLCFWGIEHGDDSVLLGIAWPPTMSFTNDCIDIFGNHCLTSNGWWRLAQLDVNQISSNAVIALAYADLPTNAMSVSAFYRLASQDDSDGDGLTDKMEEWVLGTNHLLADTDNDGLTDGAEIDSMVDPRMSDSDSDGINDGDEVGCIKVADGFIWYDTSALSPIYNTGYWYENVQMGMSSWWCQGAFCPIYSSYVVHGMSLTYLTAFETGYVSFSAPGDYNGFVSPPAPTSLDQDILNSGSIMIAAYWNNSYLYKGNTNSYIKSGSIADGTYVVEFHDVRTAPYSSLGMTYQISIPFGTGNVVRVSYLSSDYWMDGENAVVGVQNKRIVTTNGYYNLSWNFSERGPILPQTTVEYHLGYGTSPVNGDTDGDGLDDAFEIVTFHSDPLMADGDEDGMSDAQEYVIGTNPMLADTDGDGLSDKWEYDNGLNPASSIGNDGSSGDPDEDGLSNMREKVLGTLPNDSDTDADGIDDGTEIANGTSPILADSDYDGLSDSEELAIGTSPTQSDTDGDGMSDGWERAYRGANPLSQIDDNMPLFDPLVHNSNDIDTRNDYSADPDADGMTNGQESDIGTNPNNADTDGDAVSDGAELAQSSDPNDATDLGVANSRVILRFYFGDHSGSHSEKYCLRLCPVGESAFGETPRSISCVNATYGECETRTVVLVPGWKYNITLHHAGTNLAEAPDYDYTLMPTGNVPSNVIMEDNDHLFGVDETSTEFAGAGKTASLLIYTVSRVSVCVPDDSSWAELDASRVVLDDENLRIKIEIFPQICSLDQCIQMFGDTMIVKTSGTCPSGASVSIGNDAILINTSSNSEIRVTKTRQQLIAAGLLPSSNDDGVDEMAWLDMANLNADSGQDVSDSLAFALINYLDRGQSCNDQTKTIESNPPNSIPSDSYFKAAGREIINVTYANRHSNVKQIMNQADWFYFSGHGNHATGTVQGDFTPSMALNYWNRDMDVAIIAGCAVLDVRNFRFNSLGLLYRWKHRLWKGVYPGELWEMIGVKYLLGYALRAPLDTDGGSSIASAFSTNIKNGKGIITSWRDANDNAKGRNACVIDCSKVPHEFWYWNESLGSPVWTNVMKGVESW